MAGSGNTAVTFDGSSGGVGSTTTFANPTSYTEETWFKTTTTRGGKLMGFGSSRTGSSSSYDRQVYMTNSGQLVFGAYPGTTVTVTSPKTYNNGAWHLVTATQGGDGMKLYVDGALVGSDPTTGAQNYTGYWRLGGDNLSGWPIAAVEQLLRGHAGRGGAVPDEPVTDPGPGALPRLARLDQCRPDRRGDVVLHEPVLHLQRVRVERLGRDGRVLRLELR